MSKIIVAMDGMSGAEIYRTMEKILAPLSEQAKLDVAFKVNDVLADIGFTGIKNILSSIQNHFGKVIVMIDGKWNDIPQTMINYLKVLQRNNLDNNTVYITIMANTPASSIQAIVNTKKELGINAKILAVTVLTSMSDEECIVENGDNAKYTVLKQVKKALECGVDGIVCSARESEMLRTVYGDDFDIITPGIRLPEGEIHDQKRITTPADAIQNGATGLVMGRAILGSQNPAQIIEQILKDIEGKGFTVKNDYTYEKLLMKGEWLELLKYIGAIYIRPDGGKYVRFASKLISDTYYNIGVMERDFRLLERAAKELADQMKDREIIPDVIIGAQMGSVRLSSFVGKQFGTQAIYTEKTGTDPETKKDIMGLKRHEVDLKGKKVVLCEDIITKGSTISQMINIVKQAGGEVIGICCVGNRYGENEFDSIPLITCFTPPQAKLFWDEKTPQETRGSLPKLPEGVKISEKPKFDWDNLIQDMRK